VARISGTSITRAKETVQTAKRLRAAPEVDSALQAGDISLDQAAEITAAEESAPGAAAELLPVAQDEAFHVLRDKARKTRLEAEQHRDLARRQKEARGARSFSDEVGMTHIHLSFEPHVGTPIVSRAEAEAARRHR
jgi:hypothetical protein